MLTAQLDANYLLLFQALETTAKTVNDQSCSTLDQTRSRSVKKNTELKVKKTTEDLSNNVKKAEVYNI